MILKQPKLIDAIHELVYKFVEGDYETLITEGYLRGTAEDVQVIRDFVAGFPGQPIATPSFARASVRAMWNLAGASDTRMIALNLWFRDQDQDKEGDLILEIACREGNQNHFDLCIYNVIA
jgi:hypothetical protein